MERSAKALSLIHIYPDPDQELLRQMLRAMPKERNVREKVVWHAWVEGVRQLRVSAVFPTRTGVLRQFLARIQADGDYIVETIHLTTVATGTQVLFLQVFRRAANRMDEEAIKALAALAKELNGLQLEPGVCILPERVARLRCQFALTNQNFLALATLLDERKIQLKRIDLESQTLTPEIAIALEVTWRVDLVSDLAATLEPLGFEIKLIKD